MTLHELVCASAAAAAGLQASTGAMPPGHNGLYRDPETPVRNTAHWTITFAKAFELTGERRYLESAARAAAFLMSPAARPQGATFWHRESPRKDACNGLIGQAWTIEALVRAAEVLGMAEALRSAEEVFLFHPFDADAALWRRVEVDGTILSHDRAFNHQLWFAAAGALLAPHADPAVGARVRRFLDRLDDHLQLYWSGLIAHRLQSVRAVSSNGKARAIMRSLPSSAAKRHLKYKAVGYHAFNLYAFGLLKQRYPDHRCWKSDKLRAALGYSRGSTFRRRLDGNEYGYPYNPVGLEIAFALMIFNGNDTAEQAAWCSRQIERHFDLDTRLMTRNTDDPATLAARLYEATRLPDLPLRK